MNCSIVGWAGFAMSMLLVVCPGQDPVRDFAAAEALVGKVGQPFAPGVEGRGFRLSPDGSHLAWLAVADGKPMSASTDPRPLDLMLGEADGRGPRAVRLAVAQWPDYGARGPFWSADGKRVLVGYSVTDEDEHAVECIDAIDLDGKLTQLVRRRGGSLVGLVPAPRGDGFVATYFAYSEAAPRELVTCVTYDGKGNVLRSQPEGTAGPEVSFSPDGSRLAFAADQTLHVGRADAGEPERVAVVALDATIGTPPQWLLDGKRLVVAMGGGVVLAEPGAGVRHHWTERDLGGRAHAVVVLPGDTIAAAVVEREVEGGLVSLIAGAGHPQKSTFADLVFLDLSTGRLQRSKLTVGVVERGHHQLPYLPKISALLAKYRR